MKTILMDAGGTKTRACWLTDDGYDIRQSIVGGAAVPSLRFDDAVAEVLKLAKALVAKEAPSNSIADIGLSIASAGIDTPDLQEAFYRALGASFRRIVLQRDGEAALLHFFHGGPGAVAAVGTGTAISVRFPDGHVETLDAWGWPAGDRGSGAWIGRRLMEAVLRSYDLGAPMDEVLSGRLEKRIGSDMVTLRRWLNCADRFEFAALAQICIEARDEGSPLASRLLHDAAMEIAAVFGRLREKGVNSFALTGSIGSHLLSDFSDFNPAFGSTAVLDGARSAAIAHGLHAEKIEDCDD